MTSLYLVRHGETHWNAQHRIQGATDIPLNDVGREQARTTGQLLASRPWDAIITSPLSRARETARIVAAEVGLAEPTTVAALVERQYGAAEGMDWEEVEREYPNGAPVPGRETREEVAARVLPVLTEIAADRPGERILVVTHGGVIRTVLESIDPTTKHGAITNGSVHSFELVDGSLQLVAFNDPIEEESLGISAEDLDEQNALEARA